MEKLLTIVVPCFRRKAGILRLLKSIDMDRFNVVFVDDGSNEVEFSNNNDADLLTYLYGLKEFFPNIQIVTKEHSGTALTRLRGLDFVTTPYFSFADSDDEVRSDGLFHLVSKMYTSECDMGIGRFQFHMGKFSLPSRKKWQEGTHFVADDFDLGRILNIFPNKVFHSNLISTLKNIPVNAPVYEDTIPVFFLCASSNKVYVTDYLLYDYHYHSDVTSTFSYYADPVCQVGITSLYQLYLDGFKYALNHELFPKNQVSFDSMFIRLFLQRIKAMFHNRNFTQEDKDILAKDILDLLNGLIPSWRNHPDYQTMFCHCEFNDIYNSIAAYLHLRNKCYFKQYCSNLSTEEAYQQYCTDLDNIRKKIL